MAAQSSNPTACAVRFGVCEKPAQVPYNLHFSTGASPPELLHWSFSTGVLPPIAALCRSCSSHRLLSVSYTPFVQWIPLDSNRLSLSQLYQSHTILVSHFSRLNGRTRPRAGPRERSPRGRSVRRFGPCRRPPSRLDAQHTIIFVP